jgi:ribokinase
MAEASIFILGSFVAAFSAKIPRLPAAGESLRAEHFLLEAGGKGFNLAAGARRLGAAVDGIFAVGDDFLAGLAAPAFATAGLAQTVLLRKTGPTGAGIGFIDRAGETCLAIHPGANEQLGAADIAAAAPRIANASLLLAQFEIPDAPIAAAFAVARRAGGLTLLNPSPFRPIAPEILADTSILVVNQVEASQLAASLAVPAAAAPADYARLAETLAGAGPRLLVVTLGAAGAIAFNGQAAPLRQPAFAIAAIDSLGAGDAFTAAFAVALSRQSGLSNALRRAAAAGAIAASRHGVLAALPTPAELEALLTRPL